jgi:hypothetical protein
LIQSEDAIDAALKASSKLSGDMLQGRSSAGLSALFGQEALEEVIHAQLALTEARRRIVQAHRKLEVVKHEMGLDAYAAGDGSPKPPMPGLTEGQDNSQVAA